MWMLGLIACAPEEVSPACEPPDDAQITLPADDTVHDEAIEWWYWTGHLRDDDGAAFGFQLTFFLFGASETRGALVNTAVTDVEGEAFHYDADWQFLEPTRLEDGFSFDQGPGRATGGDGSDTLGLDAGPYSLDLDLAALKPPVLHHGDGYTDYDAGGHTWYASRTRMGVTGSLDDGHGDREVTGTAWFDHQWGDLQPIAEAGWDWFALTLDDGREIMLFSVRDGSEASLVGGTWADPGCGSLDIAADAVDITPLGSWTSPWTGCTYPMGWTVQVLDEVFIVTPVMEDQELVAEGEESYWEGAATVVGPMTGRAYVELTGYCG